MPREGPGRVWQSVHIYIYIYIYTPSTLTYCSPTPLVPPSSTVVPNLGSIEPQGFVESVSGVLQRLRIPKLFSTNGKNIHPQTFQNILSLVTCITVRQIFG